MLVLLVPGVGMGAGQASAGTTYVEQLGVKRGVVRSDAADVNMPNGLTGLTFPS